MRGAGIHRNEIADFFGAGMIEVWLGANICPVEHKAAGQPTDSTPVQERAPHIRGFEQIPRLKAKSLAFSIWHTQGFAWRRGRDDASFTDTFWHRQGRLLYVSGAVR